MTKRIFISYRRDDSAGHAGRVFDRLRTDFGQDVLFMDVDAIPLGANFVRVLREEVAKCDVLLAIMGPGWLGARDEAGARRLDNPTDFVRIEIAAALTRDIPVIPILLEGTRMPSAGVLPADIAELSERNGLDVRHASFHADMDKLVRGLKGTEKKANNSAPPQPISPPLRNLAEPVKQPTPKAISAAKTGNILEAIQNSTTREMIDLSSRLLGEAESKIISALAASSTVVMAQLIILSNDSRIMSQTSQIIFESRTELKSILALISNGDKAGNRLLGYIFGINAANRIGEVAATVGLSTTKGSRVMNLAVFLVISGLRNELGETPNGTGLMKLLIANKTTVATYLPSPLRARYPI